MEKLDNEFYSENIESINKICTKIFLLSNLVAPIFYIFLCLKLFLMPLIYIIITFCSTIFLSIFHFLCVYKFNKQKFAMYFGLIGFSLMIGIIGSNFNINVFIGWSFVVFLSCLYYKPKLTFFIAIFNYFVMMTSTYFKGVSGFNLANPYVRNSPLIFLLSTGGGLALNTFLYFSLQ